MTESDLLCRCGRPADFKCSEREVGPAKAISRGGQKVIVQPYLAYYACADCVKDDLADEAPPRAVKALPHHATLLKREVDEAAKALTGETHQDRLGDWGRP